MKVRELVEKYGLAVTATIPPEVLMGNGDVYFVDSGATLALDANNGEHGNSWDQPFATANYACSRCTANHNDVVLLAPTHAETIEDTGDTAGEETDEWAITVAGITVIGLVLGNVRPIFTLNTATDAAITILAGATNVTIKGIRVVSAFANVAAGITLSATSDGAVLENIEFRDTSADVELVIGISITAACDNVTIRNCSFLTADAGGSANAINSAAVTDLRIYGCTIYGVYSTGAILTSGVLVRCDIRDNDVVNDGAIALALNGTTSTGILARNMLGGTTSIGATMTGHDDLSCFENYINGDALATKSGVLTPTADSG